MAKQAKGAEGIIAANAVDISWLGKRHATLFVIGRASNGSVWGAGTQMVVWGGGKSRIAACVWGSESPDRGVWKRKRRRAVCGEKYR